MRPCRCRGYPVDSVPDEASDEYPQGRLPAHQPDPRPFDSRSFTVHAAVDDPRLEGPITQEVACPANPQYLARAVRDVLPRAGFPRPRPLGRTRPAWPQA